jgi:hypothetical protein
MCVRHVSAQYPSAPTQMLAISSFLWLRPGESRDRDRAADLRGVRPGQEVSGELDGRAVRDLGWALRGRHHLDLGPTSGRCVSIGEVRAPTDPGKPNRISPSMSPN